MRLYGIGFKSTCQVDLFPANDCKLKSCRFHALKGLGAIFLMQFYLYLSTL
jgi:hypothetical protein